MENVYDNYPQKSISQIRDKVLLGLYVFQAIKSCEVKDIEITDVNLTNYTIRIKRGSRTNERKLKLHIKQIILLCDYLNTYRAELLNEKETNRLIVIGEGKNALQNLQQKIAERLRKEVYGFEGLYQIRDFIIQYWVKEYDLRKAQYLAGHRYISSTEKFVKEDVSKLQSELIKYFPL